MKNSILFISGTLWAFCLLVGKSCPSAIYPFNTDDSNDGAILSKNSNTLDIPRDLSQPIIARFAREVEGEDPKVPRFRLLIIIIPVVMGVVVIIIIVLVVCYMRRRSERGTCFSNEWLIWCGLMKRGNPSSVRKPDDHRSVNASHDPYVKREVTDTTGQSRMPPTHDESAVRLLADSQRVEHVNRTGTCPSERSPSLPDTPNTGNSSLPPTDDESDWSPRTAATVYHRGTQPKAIKFRYPNPDGAMYPTLENISEKENNPRDNGKADRSGSDDDVLKPEIDGVSDTGSEDIGPGRKRKLAYASRKSADEDTVNRANQPQILVNNLHNGSDSIGSHYEEEDERKMKRLIPNELNYANGSFPGEVFPEDYSSQIGQRKSPNNASSGDTFQEINGQYVHLHFYSPVDTVHVGDRETKHIFFPKDSADTIPNTCAFNRFSLERKTH